MAGEWCILMTEQAGSKCNEVERMVRMVSDRRAFVEGGRSPQLADGVELDGACKTTVRRPSEILPEQAVDCLTHRALPRTAQGVKILLHSNGHGNRASFPLISLLPMSSGADGLALC